MATTPELLELNTQQRQQLLRQLLKKGAEVNEQLVQLLADPSLDIRNLPLNRRPGERPEERLRRFLQLIDSKIHAIEDGSYGRCEECQQPLSFTELEQMPWADQCHGCAEKGTA